MGDILHALPAAVSLKHSLPSSSLTWVVESAWAPLLAENSFVDRVIALDRKRPRTWTQTLRELREQKFGIAMDLQGLFKSALTASLARPEKLIGYDRALVRERVASWFYSNRISSTAAHVVDRHLDIAAAAGAVRLLRSFPLPTGIAEGDLPDGAFVLASPFAGWKSKQWPIERYSETAREVKRRWGVPLVLNGPPSAREALLQVPDTLTHISSVAGLIDATRRATAIIGVDSGPMHLAAALGKPGVAIFGPTDPKRNGPYGGTMEVVTSGELPQQLRRGDYDRGGAIDPRMLAVPVGRVVDALAPVVDRSR